MSRQKGGIEAGETSRVPGPLPLLFNHTGLLCFFIIPSLSLPQGLCTCCLLYLGPSSACSLHDNLFAAFRSQLTCHLLREVLPNHQSFSTVSPGFFKACGTICKDCPHLFVCFFSAPLLDYKFHESGDCVFVLFAVSLQVLPLRLCRVCAQYILGPHILALKVKMICPFANMGVVFHLYASICAIPSVLNALPSAFTWKNGFETQHKWTREKVHLKVLT